MRNSSRLAVAAAATLVAALSTLAIRGPDDGVEPAGKSSPDPAPAERAASPARATGALRRTDSRRREYFGQEDLGGDPLHDRVPAVPVDSHARAPAAGRSRGGSFTSSEPSEREVDVPRNVAAVGRGGGASPARLRLETLASRLADPRVALVGFDPDGPRDLVLWEVAPEHDRAAHVAEITSAADGRIQADGLLIPVHALGLVVAPVGAPPFGPDASPVFVVEAVPLEAPRAWLERRLDVPADAGLQLAVAVTGAACTLVVGDVDGRDLDWLTIPAQLLAQRTARVVRFDVAREARWIARVLPDGRRSAWASLRHENERAAR